MGIIHQMNIGDIDLNLLRVFHFMAQERSVTRAAERLDLSQPAGSNALKRLRQVFDDELFVRGVGGMSPTPRADQLSAPIADALQRIEAALLGGPEVDPTRLNEPITITCADEEILLHGGDILSAIRDAGCPAPVQFLPLNTEYRADLLWRNRLSLTISTIIFAPEGLRQRKVYDEHLVCLMRADHPTADQFDLDAYLCAEHLLIAPLGGGPSGYLDDWLRERGLKRNVCLISHSFGSAHSLVLETGLIATLPSLQARRDIYGDQLKTAQLPVEAPPFSVHIFWSERYDGDPANKWLRSTVHTAMMSLPQLRV